MDNLLTAKQVQDLLNLDRTTIYRMLKDGRLAGVKVGQHWRFSAREVNDILLKTTRINGAPTPWRRTHCPCMACNPYRMFLLKSPRSAQ